MKHILLLLALLPTWLLQAQPLNGSYTVGGSAPDFATLQDAASAIKSRGVSGAVFFNIRPGTYTKDGGASTLFVLDSTIAGASSINRITFQPDAASGGNVDNVILQADFNSSSIRILVRLSADYVTLRNLTFKDADSMDTPVGHFIYAGFDNNNPSIDGLEFDGCKFIGTPYFIAGEQFGTDIGFGSNQTLSSASFTNNRLYRILRGITNENGNNRGGAIIVEDNEFYQGYRSATGSGNPLGTAIELACTYASVKRNIIDLAGGRGAKSGIEVNFATTAIIERNLIKNRVALGGPFDDFTGISVRNVFFVTDSITIVNNAIISNAATVRTYCMRIETPNTKVLYNTMVNVSGGLGANIALNVTGANCTVLNNIILEFSSASFVAFDQGSSGQAQNLVSNHNIIYLPEGHGASGLVRRNGTMFPNLSAYQSATGLDINSAFRTVNFSDGFHIDDCEAQNPDSTLHGIPIPGITIDYDGQQRDSVSPFKGADEGVLIPFDMFADGFRAGLPGPPLSLATGDFFDNDNDDDIAVPTYDNRQVLLFRNQRPGRSFVQAGELSTSFQPTVIKLFDFDRDGHLDLIVGGDTSAVQVFWNDGGGGFSSSAVVGTYGRVRSIEVGAFVPTIADTPGIALLTEDNGFLPTSSFLGFVGALLGTGGSRDLCHDAQRLPSQVPVPPFPTPFDTLQASMTALVAGNLTGSQTAEIAALTIGPIPSELILFKDVDFVFTFPIGAPCGTRYNFVATHTAHNFGTASYVGHTSSIVMRDFDGDGDNDLLTTSATENSCILLRNQGVLNFAPDTIPTTQTRAIVALDYENDGDLDFVAANRTLFDKGITVFLNDGSGHFTPKPNCYFPFASGFPNGIVASDFDLDGKTDIAIASSFDSLFVLYNIGGFNGTTGVDDNPQQQLPGDILLSQNYPNPFNPSTRIEYKLSTQSHVTLKIYNILGQEVASLVDEEQMSGGHIVDWNGKSSRGFSVSSGVYFYRLEARQATGQFLFAGVKKMILMK